MHIARSKAWSGSFTTTSLATPNTSSMNYFNRYDNVFMDGGAAVQQRLKHEDIYILGGVGVYHGDWHVHYLE